MHTLKLYNSNIGDAGAVAIAEALKFNAVLNNVDLYSNKIGDAGAIAIAESLKFNAELKLETLIVPAHLGKHPQLVAACREKGVKLN